MQQMRRVIACPAGTAPDMASHRGVLDGDDEM